MSETLYIENASILAAASYKISCILAGTAFGYLGYRLFALGVWGKAGSMEVHYQDSKLLLRSAAPGTFFVVLGALIIAATILTHFEINSSRNEAGANDGKVGEKKPVLP